MKIILTQNVKGLGRAGEVVRVSDGYARNLLIPKGWAKLADEKALETLQNRAKIEEKKAGRAAETAKALVEALRGRVFEFVRRADKKGHLYAGLKESEISAKMREGEASHLLEPLVFVKFSPPRILGKHKVRALSHGKEVEIDILIKPAANGKGTKQE